MFESDHYIILYNSYKIYNRKSSIPAVGENGYLKSDKNTQKSKQLLRIFIMSYVNLRISYPSLRDPQAHDAHNVTLSMRINL